MSTAQRRSFTIEVPLEEAGNPIPPLDRLTVRVPEAAQLLSISRAAVYRLLSSGEIEASKSGQKTLVIVASIKAFVERNRVAVSLARPPVD
jgi:excisionase family DNA binding protein